MSGRAAGQPRVAICSNAGLGLLAAEVAVLARYWLDLPYEVLPFFLVIIAICLVTVFAGLVGGVTTMIVGGILTWYYRAPPERHVEPAGRQSPP